MLTSRDREADMKSMPVALTSIALVMGLGAATSFADERRGQDNPNSEEAAFLAADISLGDAIRIAEESSAGRAMSGEFEREDGQWAYSIEVLGPDNTELELLIDPETGAVLKTEKED